MIYHLNLISQHGHTSHTLLPLFEKLINQSSNHFLTDNPKLADIILIVDGHQAQELDIDKRYLDIGISDYRDKIVLYDQSDRPRIRPNVIGPCFHRITTKYSYVKGYPLAACVYVTWPSDGIWPNQDSDEVNYTFNFIGSNTHPIRRAIVATLSKNPSCFVLDTSDKNKGLCKPEYMNIIQNSAGTLCPRGHGYATWRMYEALSVGSVPIIISDHFAEPVGLHIDECSVQISEWDVVRSRKYLEKSLKCIQEIDNRVLPSMMEKLSINNRFELIHIAAIDSLSRVRTKNLDQSVKCLNNLVRAVDAMRNKIYQRIVPIP